MHDILVKDSLARAFFALDDSRDVCVRNIREGDSKDSFIV
jgi:hypothetical protein